ncbi:MAG: carbamoyltransferase HypF [Candidatus Eisenbacteria bacterium]|nr:carbamoyltransferase HypF [Candidatus Eisenbacteria bacterium]
MTEDVVSRLRLEIRGAVQGVGFRPFVYRLAEEFHLTGWVLNDARGVFLEVEGPRPALERFRERVETAPPPRAVLKSVEAAWLEPAGLAGFEIRHSDGGGSKSALVLPDIATCPDCRREVFDPSDRRHGHPFTNCTNCGPRFTILRGLPYDRPNTTMSGFPMCPACRAEYEDPRDRRFHAQPNACPECGPRAALWAADGSELAGTREAIPEAARALAEGRIVAVKGLGGFHLACDARSEPAVARLRERKHRWEKPLALMARDVEQAREFCDVDEVAVAHLESPEAPILLLPRKVGDVGAGGAEGARVASDAGATASISTIAPNVAPGNPCLGVMLPSTPLQHLLLRACNFPVVATSGNLSEEPLCTDEREALVRLAGIADLFLVHDRPIRRHVDDSVAWSVRGGVRLVRRARGYAPLPVSVARELPPILAVGAHQKNTVALSVGRQVFVSQHIGDLETPQAREAFERVIADFLSLYGARPLALAHDLHPDFVSTRWAKAWMSQDGGHEVVGSAAEGSPAAPAPAGGGAARLVAVQHHHAHLASCLAENGVSGRALGVTWDGTGYGTDGTVWGGEFLVGDASGYERVAALRPFRLPGGEAAVREPRRTALALLWEHFGVAALEREDLAVVRAVPAAERRVLATMLSRGLNAPVTTSAGRLFDAVAALAGLHLTVSFEGQAAMALEFAADPAEMGRYTLGCGAAAPSGVRGVAGEASRGPHAARLTLDWGPMLEEILEDLCRGRAAGTIAARFMNALVAAAVEVARAVDEPRVALTGGCFQNRLLTDRMSRALEEDGRAVLLHAQVPPNDGGISLGQVMVAAAQM